MKSMRTFHVSQRETGSSQAEWRPIDIHHGFLTERDPGNALCVGMLVPYDADDFVNSTYTRLSKRVDSRSWDIAEVDCTSNILLT